MIDLKKRLIENGVRYIAVEGNIGAGKTTLARLIASETGAVLFEEQVNDNPFLPKFYQDKDSYAFQAQIFFLLNRYRQQSEITQRDLFADLVVSDYLFAKDSIFANVVLGDDELVLYNRILEQLKGRIARPDLVVYLQASPSVLMERIKKRGRSFEKGITEDYICTLNEAFNYFFFHYEDSSLLIVNTDRVDFTTDRTHLERLFERLAEKFSGTRFYVPSWEREEQ